MHNPMPVPALAAVLLFLTTSTGFGESPSVKPRLLNTLIFGRSIDEAVVLLEPKAAHSVAPETVMVDVDKDKYFAATVRYPKEIGFEDLRRTLNERYGKWESKDFADDPTMGIWRNEEEQVSMQLTEDEDNIVLIYIRYSLVSSDIMARSFKRAFRDMDDNSEDNASANAKGEGQVD